jgi:hypothetical protein
VFIAERPTMGDIEIEDISITTATDGAWYTDLFLRGAGNDSFHEEFSQPVGGFLDHDTTIPNLPVGEWHRHAISLDLDARTYQYDVDGEPAWTTIIDNVVITAR